MTSSKLILASQSRARSRLLANAGLTFTTAPADIDEEAIRQTLDKDGPMPPEDVATILAETKANVIAEQNPLAYVIGADQVLEFGGVILSKAENKEAARDALLKLRGHTHRLMSAVVVSRAGATLWRHVEIAELEMREFSNEFLGQYLHKMGDKVCETVGAYEIEGRGLQLFSKVSGDLFTIQGLPLLPLLGFLRKQSLIQE